MVREDSSKDVMFKLRLNDEQKLGLKNLGGGGELQRGKSKHKDSKGCVIWRIRSQNEGGSIERRKEMEVVNDVSRIQIVFTS